MKRKSLNRKILSKHILTTVPRMSDLSRGHGVYVFEIFLIYVVKTIHGTIVTIHIKISYYLNPY